MRKKAHKTTNVRLFRAKTQVFFSTLWEFCGFAQTPNQKPQSQEKPLQFAQQPRFLTITKTLFRPLTFFISKKHPFRVNLELRQVLFVAQIFVSLPFCRLSDSIVTIIVTTIVLPSKADAPEFTMLRS